MIKKIIKTIYLLTFILSFSACTKYAQIFNAKSTSSSLILSDNNFPVFENDTIRIVYSFWAEGGNMSFAIFNKYSRPIYIDWKKCAYILNGQKFDYFQESVTSTSLSNDISYSDIFGRVNTVGVQNNKLVKSERVIFIPPNSGVKLSTYQISDLTYHLSNFKIAKTGIKTTGEYNIKIGKEDHSVNFRSFITYSTTEDFRNEQFIDNGFFVESITICKMNSFVKKTGVDKKGNPIFTYPKEQANKFYLSNLKRSSFSK
jgi:hypothetical protein